VVLVFAFAAVARVALRGSGHISNETLPWLVLIAFGVLTAFLTAVARARVLGATQANLSRYTTASSLLVVGVVMLLLRAVERGETPSLRAPAIAGIAAVMALVGLNFLEGIKDMETHYREEMLPTLRCAENAATVHDPCVNKTFLPPAWPYVKFVREHDLAGL
jgi:hypothetical protein